MPALALAVREMEKRLSFGILPKEAIAAEEEDKYAIVQHCYNKTLLDKFGIPAYEGWHPYDTDPTDFTWVDW